jgi:phage-related minor tail protein
MTGKFKFKDFAASVIQDILKIQLRASAAQLLGNIPGIGAFFSVPGRAMGGPVSANSPYIIGERGPELFVPQSSGTVVPNNRLGGGSTIINNITAIDAKGVAQLFAENRQVLFGNVEQARRELPMRMR